MANSIKAKVFRYDPTVDAAPYYQDYDVPWQEDESGFMTGLQVLHYIYENVDPIAYDHNCRASLCGRCSMVIDGKPGLACYTPLQPGEHTFEPLEGLPIVRDLIVDRASYMRKFIDTAVAKKTVDPVVQSDPIDYDLYWNTLEYLNNCRECMCCYDVCPALQERSQWDYIGPGAMMQVAFRHLDPHDEADRVSEAVFSGLWNCDLCGKCSTVCPAQIDHMSLLSLLQSEAEDRGLKPKEMPKAVALGNGTPSSSGTATATASSSPRDAETIIKESCSEDGCHSESLIGFKTDASKADTRANKHATTHTDLSDEEKASLLSYFTE